MANPLSDQVKSTNEEFQITVPSSTFADVDGHSIIYDTAEEVTNVATGTTGPLANWLAFNTQTGVFYGFNPTAAS